jgi:hypothetical protein
MCTFMCDMISNILVLACMVFTCLDCFRAHYFPTDICFCHLVENNLYIGKLGANSTLVKSIVCFRQKKRSKVNLHCSMLLMTDNALNAFDSSSSRIPTLNTRAGKRYFLSHKSCMVEALTSFMVSLAAFHHKFFVSNENVRRNQESTSVFVE